MKFIPVEKIPQVRTCNGGYSSEYKPMYAYLTEFMKMNVKYALVTFAPTDYANSKSAESCIRDAIRRHSLPIKIVVRNREDIYLTRTDMEET